MVTFLGSFIQIWNYVWNLELFKIISFLDSFKIDKAIKKKVRRSLFASYECGKGVKHVKSLDEKNVEAIEALREEIQKININ